MTTNPATNADDYADRMPFLEWCECDEYTIEFWAADHKCPECSCEDCGLAPIYTATWHDDDGDWRISDSNDVRAWVRLPYDAETEDIVRQAAMMLAL